MHLFATVASQRIQRCEIIQWERFISLPMEYFTTVAMLYWQSHATVVTKYILLA